MDLKAIESNWDKLVERVLDVFPETERAAVEGFSGRISAFVEYLAKIHDLTRLEAVQTIEERLALPYGALLEDHQHSMAAE